MNILNLTRTDYAGLAIRLTDAINKYTPHRARLLTQRPHRYKYSRDIETKDPHIIKKWVDWADVVHGWPTSPRGSLCKIPNKKLIWTHVGTSFIKNQRHYRKLARELKIRVFVSTPNLLYYKGLTWLPSAVPVDEWFNLKTPHTGKPIVCQTPSGRRGKRTNAILEQIAHKKNIDIHIIEKVFWQKCMLLKSKADIYLGFFGCTYGMGELEAWAMGIPVISHIPPPHEKLHFQEIGYLPYYDAPLEQLSEAIDTLLSDKTLYDEYAKRGFEYVKRFHDYPVVAKKFIEVCEEL